MPTTTMPATAGESTLSWRTESSHHQLTINVFFQSYRNFDDSIDFDDVCDEFDVVLRRTLMI